MLRLKRITIFIYIFIFIMLNLGCSKNSLFPKADVVLSSTDSDIIPTTNIATNISASTITVTLLNGVTCSVTGCTYTYKTNLGEIIPITFTDPLDSRIAASNAGNSTANITIRPYRQEIIDLFEQTSSAISPIQVTVTVHFSDINKNEFDKEIHFRCWKYITSNPE